MSIAPLVFTGVSQYSSDFQSIVNRAVSIAQIPVQALQNQQANMVTEKMSFTNLSSAVASLATSVGNLGTLGSSKALSATSTDPMSVTATATGATQGANYQISNITSVATAASETSLKSYAATDVFSSTGQLTLSVGSKSYTIDVSGNNTLAGVAKAINAMPAAGISASVITTSNGSYLSLSAMNTGKNAISLTDGNTALLTSQNPGSNTEFMLNGVPVSESGRVISDVVAGTTFTFTGTTTPGETIGISLTTDRSQLASALQDLATKYNAVADQVNAQIGPNAGLLSGNSIIGDVRGAMLSLVNYSGGSGQVKSLAALGIELDATGHMSFNADTFNALTDSQVSDGFSYLGSTTAGFGALQKQFSQISDPVTGSIQAQLNSYAAANTRISKQISDMTDRINTMQTALQAKLQTADALLASLESQQNILTQSIQGLNYTSYGKAPGSN